MRLAGGLRQRGEPQLGLPERTFGVDLVEHGLLRVGILAGIAGLDGSVICSLRTMRIGSGALKRRSAGTTRQRDKQAVKK